MTARVTIAIPTFNRAKYLRVALHSALQQSWPNLEVIVSDNASTDDTATFLDGIIDPRVVRLSQDMTIPVFNHWDSCLRSATGEYFLLLSDDDLLAPDAIEQMIMVFEQARANGEELGFVTCRTTVVSSEGSIRYRGSPFPIPASAESVILDFFRSKVEIVPCALLFPTAAIRPGYTQYASEFSLAADAIVWIKRILETGKAGFVDQDLAFYRTHSNTTTTTCLTKWHVENVMLAEYVIRQLKAHGRGEGLLYREIRKAAEQLNTRITAAWIVNAWGNSKAAAFGLARQHARTLVHPYGAMATMKAVCTAMIPLSWRRSLVAVRRLVRNRLSRYVLRG